MAGGWFDYIRRLMGGGSSSTIDTTKVYTADTIRFIPTYSGKSVAMQFTNNSDTVRALPTYSGVKVQINTGGI